MKTVCPQGRVGSSPTLCAICEVRSLSRMAENTGLLSFSMSSVRLAYGKRICLTVKSKNAIVTEFAEVAEWQTRTVQVRVR